VTRRLPLITLALLAFAATACGRYLTTAVAVVDGITISKDKLDKQVASVLASPQFSGSVDPNNAEQRLAIERQVIVQLIQQELIAHEADRLKIKVTEADVQARFQQVRGQFATEDQFRQALQQNGLTEAQLLTELRQQLKIEGVQTTAVGTIQATEQEIKAQYGNGQAFEEIRIRHILVLVQPGADPAAAKRKAQTTLAKLKAGADFATLAKQLSEDPGSKDKGGDLGYVTRDVNFDEQFKTAAFALKEGELSGVVQSSFGFHIIRVDDRRTKTLAQVHAQIAEQITTEKRRQAFNVYLLDRLRKANVVVNPRWGDFNPETLQIDPHSFFVPPSPEPETQPVPFG
jgi:foldase protein PrsA